MRVGTVRAIWRYPVKSMRGEALTEAPLGWHGLEGDRRYAFVQRGDFTNFPWLTGREVHPMLHYAPFLTDSAEPRTCLVRVKTPDGRDLAIEDEALRAELEARAGRPLHLLHLNIGAFDSMPVSLLTTAALAGFGAHLEATPEARRFRPNLVIEPEQGDAPFPEDGWMGAHLTFGEPSRPDRPMLRVDRPISRCVMITRDPDGSESDPAIARVVAREHDNVAGVYGTPVALGTIQVGDPVWLDRQ